MPQSDASHELKTLIQSRHPIVTIDTVMETVVADGFWTVAEICTPDYAAACIAAGIE